MSSTGLRALSGYSVGITGHRRREEQAELLTRRGAQVVHGPVMETRSLADADVAIRATEHVLAAPIDVTILTTGIGVRSWFAAADSVGLGLALRDHLNASRVVARGPKALHAARAVGLQVGWSAPGETAEEVLAEVASAVPGRRVVVQRDGGAPIVAGAVAAAGASEVIDVAVYEWHLPTDRRPAERLLDAAAHGDVDALTFTSSYAVGNAFAMAHDAAVLADALSDPVVAVAVGPVTAAALRDHGVRTVIEPNAARLGAMIHALTCALRARSRTLSFAGASCTWQGALLIDAAGRRIELTTGERRLLRSLVGRAPAVVSKGELGVDGVDGHAVESAVARLRAKLGPLGGGIRTVRRRGYACELHPVAVAG